MSSGVVPVYRVGRPDALPRTGLGVGARRRHKRAHVVRRIAHPPGLRLIDVPRGAHGTAARWLGLAGKAAIAALGPLRAPLPEPSDVANRVRPLDGL